MLELLLPDSEQVRCDELSLVEENVQSFMELADTTGSSKCRTSR